MFLLLQVVPSILSCLFIACKDCSTIETISIRHPVAVFVIYGLPCRLMLLSHSAALRVKKLKAIKVYIKFQSFMDKLGQLWSNLDKFGQVWTSFDKFRQVSTSFDKFRQVSTSFDKFRQVWINLDKLTAIWTMMNNIRPIKTCVDKFRQVWSILDNFR